MRNDPSPGATGLTVCIAENRASCEPALRILVASMSEHCPNTRAILFCPNATEAFEAWMRGYPHCELNPCAIDGPWTKYDIKPLALLTALRIGAENLLWIDSDIAVANDFGPLFASLAPDMLCVAEEALAGGYGDADGLRARAWGLPVGRSLPFAVNTGVIRVTRAHRGLLETWHGLLQSESYRAAQAAAWNERPPHLAGDQEVLTALLASESYAGVPLKFLRRGYDIIQFFGASGYTTRERLGHLRHGLPPFIHSQGFHPWWGIEEPVVGFTATLAQLYRVCSPYTTYARRYAHVLEDDRWLTPSSVAAQLLRSKNPALAGFPIALVADVLRLAKARSTPPPQPVVSANETATSANAG